MGVPLPKKLEEIISELERSDPAVRAELLIEYAEGLEQVPPEVATRPFPEKNRVPSCESEAFVFLQTGSDGASKYYFAVENPQGISAKALGSILNEALSGHPAGDSQSVPEDIVYRIFGRTLSMGKGQGLMSMVGMVKELSRERSSTSFDRR